MIKMPEEKRLQKCRKKMNGTPVAALKKIMEEIVHAVKGESSFGFAHSFAAYRSETSNILTPKKCDKSGT